MPDRKKKNHGVVDNVPGQGNHVVQGSIIRRRGQKQATTTDQRLLAGAGDTAWSHSDPWRTMRIQAEFVDGFGTLAELGPAISLFGSARTRPEHPMWGAAERMAAALVAAGYAVITGGGPGVMEAANKGADEAGGTSVGLGIELPFEASMNSHVNLGINFRYFFVRKVMFLKYAQGFIVMPGGLGTFDELFEALTLAQTGKVQHFPVVLFGVDYWRGLVDWLRDAALAEGYISPADLEMFLVTDDEQAAVAHVTAGRGAGGKP
ncbi:MULTISPECIES: LOG family protein [unclassified Luteococcus]|uniref:LOG family protein n=1 Tax=unclassified Luteococcus TaxID=2639923 RepID=UPI00313D6B77